MRIWDWLSSWDAFSVVQLVHRLLLYIQFKYSRTFGLWFTAKFGYACVLILKMIHYLHWHYKGVKLPDSYYLRFLKFVCGELRFLPIKGANKNVSMRAVPAEQEVCRALADLRAVVWFQLFAWKMFFLLFPLFVYLLIYLFVFFFFGPDPAVFRDHSWLGAYKMLGIEFGLEVCKTSTLFAPEWYSF